jgi:hypothetical protein
MTTALWLWDSYTDTWNGAFAHIDAYTGFSQWTHVAGLDPAASVNTIVKETTGTVGSVKSIGCQRNGCYAIHFSSLGEYPSEIAISTAFPYNASTCALHLGHLDSLDDRFFFTIQDGVAFPADHASCVAEGPLDLFAGVGGELHCLSGTHDEDGDLACEACLTSCPNSSFVSGQCSTASNPTCEACGVKPNSTNSESTDNECGWQCTPAGAVYVEGQCSGPACYHTPLYLWDSYGESWDGGTAHIDAYTGTGQWTHVHILSPATGELATDLTMDVPYGHVHSLDTDVGCRRDGCYAAHFTVLGSYPWEIAISSTWPINVNNTIVGLGSLASTSQHFFFTVAGGVAAPATEAECVAAGPVTLAAGAGGETHCLAGTHDEDGDHVCAQCTASCDIGALLTGTCDAASNPSCSPCPAKSENNSQWLAAGTCAWECVPGFAGAECMCTGGYIGADCESCPEGQQDAANDGVCEPCTDACSVGLHLAGTCSTASDLACIACDTKPANNNSEYHGLAADGYPVCHWQCTPADATYPNSTDCTGTPCYDTTVWLLDTHGDTWNGATAHIDAYTGTDQWTHVASLSPTDSDLGEITKLTGSDEVHVHYSTKNVGCRRDGCYSVHFTDLGLFPLEVGLYSHYPFDASSRVVGLSNLVSLTQRFFFSVDGGEVLPASQAACEALGHLALADGVGGDVHCLPGTHDADGDGTCAPCTACAAGSHWDGPCTETSNPSCTACTSKPQNNSEYTTAGTCNFACTGSHAGTDCMSCAVGFTGAGDGACQACTTAGTVSPPCAVGEYIGACTATADAQCVACTAAPANSDYTTALSCDFACTAGHVGDDCLECSAGYQDANASGTCVPCSTAETVSPPCAAGEFIGACTTTADAQCTACATKPATHSEYTTVGSCGWQCTGGYTGIGCYVCHPGHHDEQATGTCAPCTGEYACPTGTILDSTCSTGNNPACTTCTGKPESNSEYPTFGSCSWQCTGGYSGPDCLAPPVTAAPTAAPTTTTAAPPPPTTTTAAPATTTAAP